MCTAGSSCLTSLGFGEAVVQAEDDLLYKVLDVSGLWPSDKHHPVVGEAFRCHFLPQLSSVAQLQLHLHRALNRDRRKQTNSDTDAQVGPRDGLNYEVQVQRRRTGLNEIREEEELEGGKSVQSPGFYSV